LPGAQANITSYNSVSINPFTTYNVTVPSGGYVTIRWFAQ
jgi:hypothetical protein